VNNMGNANCNVKNDTDSTVEIYIFNYADGLRTIPRSRLHIQPGETVHAEAAAHGSGLIVATGKGKSGKHIAVGNGKTIEVSKLMQKGDSNPWHNTCATITTVGAVVAAPVGIGNELVVKPIKCAVRGEKYTLDAAGIINPIRGVHNTIQTYQSCVQDQDKDVWVGRHGLGNSVVGISGFGTGLDVYHWALMVNGHVYHREGRARTDGRWYDDQGKKFEWYHMGSEFEVIRSHTQIKAEAEQLAKKLQAHWE